MPETDSGPAAPAPAPEFAAQQRTLGALHAALKRQHGAVQLFETHISWVLVAGGRAWKLKKALRLPFLDFSSLAARRHFCEEELRLNRRLAPDLYLAVVPIVAGAEQAAIDLGQQADAEDAEGALSAVDGPVVEYALLMRAFEQDGLWEHKLARDALSRDEVDALADHLAEFHARAAVAPAESAWGSPASIAAVAEDNFQTLLALAAEAADKTGSSIEAASATSNVLTHLRDWDQAQRARLHDVFQTRKAEGRVREGHGDLHCGNIVSVGESVQAFDCLEFNAGMRWIDVCNDIAFTCMDLSVRGRADLAYRFLNRYLERSGDYGVLAVLRYYLVQRALVRCKVAWLNTGRGRARGAGGLAYLDFAQRCTRPGRAAIILMHGYSGSGKSTVAAQLAERLDAIRIRSDVERKRPGSLPMEVGPGSDPALYSAAAIARTYARLAALTREIVQAGYPVVVDASFLHAAPRADFRALARTLGVPFLIVDVRAPLAVMRARLAARARAGSDPSDADATVLAAQMAQHAPLTADEGCVIAIDNSGSDKLNHEASLSTGTDACGAAPMETALGAIREKLSAVHQSCSA